MKGRGKLRLVPCHRCIVRDATFKNNALRDDKSESGSAGSQQPSFTNRQLYSHINFCGDVQVIPFQPASHCFCLCVVTFRLLYDMESTSIDIEHSIFINSKTDIGYKTAMLKKVIKSFAYWLVCAV